MALIAERAGEQTTNPLVSTLKPDSQKLQEFLIKTAKPFADNATFPMSLGMAARGSARLAASVSFDEEDFTLLAMNLALTRACIRTQPEIQGSKYLFFLQPSAFLGLAVLTRRYAEIIDEDPNLQKAIYREGTLSAKHLHSYIPLATTVSQLRDSLSEIGYPDIAHELKDPLAPVRGRREKPVENTPPKPPVDTTARLNTESTQPSNTTNHLLTPRQQEILNLLGKNFTGKELDQALTIAPGTRKELLRQLYRRLGVARSNQAIIVAIQGGLIPKPDHLNGSPKIPLSPREEEVLAAFIKDGGINATDRAVAQELHLGPKTVSTHKSHIFAKLGVRSIREAILAIS